MKKPWLFRVFFGDEISYPVMWGLLHKPRNTDPVVKQPVFNGKYPSLFFFVAQASFLFVISSPKNPDLSLESDGGFQSHP